MTCNGDDNDDEIDAVGDNDSLVTTRGRMENMARIRLLDLIANFTGFVDFAAAVLTIGTTIERGKVCNFLHFGLLNMYYQVMEPPLSFLTCGLRRTSTFS